MINWFRKRQETIRLSRLSGYNAGKSEAERYYKARLANVREEVKKIIASKNKEIEWRDKYIDDIKLTIENYMDTLTEAAHIMQAIEQAKNLELLELTKKQQQIQTTIDQVVSIARRSKKFSKVQNKIEMYNVKRLN